MYITSLAKNKCIFAIMLLGVFLVGCATTKKGLTSIEPISNYRYTPSGNEPKVVVYDFDNATFFESKTLGPGVATMFQTSMVRSNRFQVIDRENIVKIFDEYKLGMAGATNIDITNIGKQLGADYIITGKITEFGIKKTGTSFGAGVVDAQSFTGGGAQIKKEKGTARIAVDIKITEIKTGRIFYMVSTTGTASSDNVNAGFGVLTGTALTGLKIGSGVQGFDETIAGKASRDAANKIVDLMVQEKVFNW